MSLKAIREGKYNAAKEVMLSYSAQTMADALGVSFVTYQRKEAEPTKYLKMEEAEILAEMLGTDVAALYAAK